MVSAVDEQLIFEVRRRMHILARLALAATLDGLGAIVEVWLALRSTKAASLGDNRTHLNAIITSGHSAVRLNFDVCWRMSELAFAV